MNDIVVSILSSIGGTTLILGGLFGWLGQRYLAKHLETEKAENREKLAKVEKELTKEIESHRKEINKEIELHKTQLKYDATFFSNLFNASNELYTIVQNILPKRHYPEMEWTEACEEIALSFEEHEAKLDTFLNNFFTPLPPDIVEEINKAKSNCSEGKFEVSGQSVSETGRKLADELFEILNSTSIKLKSYVDEKRKVKTINNF